MALNMGWYRYANANSYHPKGTKMQPAGLAGSAYDADVPTERYGMMQGQLRNWIRKFGNAARTDIGITNVTETPVTIGSVQVQIDDVLTVAQSA